MEQMSGARSNTASSVTCEDTCGMALENVDPKRRVKRHTTVENIIIIHFYDIMIAPKICGEAFDLEIKLDNVFNYIT